MSVRVREWAEVLENRNLGGGLYQLFLKSPRIAAAARAGAFVLLAARPGRRPSNDPLLPRPFSLLAARPASGEIEIFYRVVGRGTELMTALQSGEEIAVTGPLGRPWPEPTGDAVLVAGGVGMPPLLYLAETMAERRAEEGGRLRATLFFGAGSADQIQLVERFEAAGVRVHVSTDDGSTGSRETCVDALREWLEAGEGRGATIFGCGPEGMLAALAALARRFGLDAHVSLEAPMACGIGVCRGCAVKMRDGGYRMACTDGPVFDAKEVAFS